MITDPALQKRLLELAQHDLTVREELLRTGELFQGYQPRMEAVHIANARALEPFLESGWPTVAQVGEDGQRAAWLIVQHAISLPPFQRRCCELLAAAVARGDVPGWQLAMLTDRVCTLEGRPQRYGTQFDWDAAGDLSPLPLEDATRVDEWRAQIGLEPLAEATARHRLEARKRDEHTPTDSARRQAEQEAWAKRVGWRSASPTTTIAPESAGTP